jgi:hypothetical protein
MAAERAAFDAAPARRDELVQLCASASTSQPRRLRLELSRRGWALAGSAAALGVAALLLWLPEPRDEVASKGSSSLTVYQERSGGAALLGRSCEPGARLMLHYRTDRRWLLIVQRDGRGDVQVLFPRGGAASGRVPGPEGATAHSFILDAVPGRECFTAFFTDQPMDAAAAGRALAASPEAPLPFGVEVRSQCCTKEGAR